MKSTNWRMGLAFLLPLLLAGLLPSTLFADAGDPPGRVARLSIVEGKVSFQPSGETDWSEATVNRPVTTGDRVYTDAGGRAELEVGPFTVRLSEATDVTLANLNDQLMQLGVGQGTLRVTIYEMPENNSVEIDTPNGALSLQTPGSYRVDTAADGNSTQVTVNAGTLQISAGDLSDTVESGQSVHLTGTGPVAASKGSAPGPDEFDQWCAGRDRRIEQSTSAQKVGPAVPGGEDLDANGTWSEQPEYGTVWIPAHVAPDWVPYRYGHWVFMEPWGWTWVEAEPWGYAPFHYGRWAHIGPVWAWVPGPVVMRPVYAPALVAFVGGPGFGIGMGVGVQAWFPLGPREPFEPWYHHGGGYMREVNVVNVTNITNYHYANRGVAVTAVSGEVFRGGQPVEHGRVRVRGEDLARAQVIPHPEVNPTSHAVFGARNVAAPPVHPGRFGAPERATMVTRAPEHTSTVTPSGPRTFPAPLTREATPTGGPSTRQFPTSAPVTREATPAGGPSTRQFPTSAPATREATPAGGPPTRQFPTSAPVTREATPAGGPSTRQFPTSAPVTREATPAGGPPTREFPRVFTRSTPAPANAPFQARQDAYSSHPGRPLEPQQMNNLRVGKPAGPMRDKETIPHPAPVHSESRTPPPSHASHGDQKHH